ncbi:receptor-type tyrosine-protein kinase FLT3-like isoform X2 [Mugil cephalus]|nr:receptor-type tyrosine-protein kinase FLT3-like isoform X2 [Mugil cephalus]
MIAAVLLLCAVSALGSDGAEPQNCVPSYEVACLLPADYLNESDPVTMDLFMGKKLVISLKGLPGSFTCHWNRTDHSEMTINGSHAMVISALSEKDSGTYTLTCQTNSTQSSVTVNLNVLRPPTRPRLMLDRVNKRIKSALFKCTSEGFPRPEIQWSEEKKGTYVTVGNEGAERSVSVSNYPKSEVMCCATNTEGQECSQLYDYDFQTASGSQAEVSNLTLSPGQTLLLRCQKGGYTWPYPVWEKDGERLEARTVGCDLKKEMCIKNYRHAGRLFAYLLMTSLNFNNSGTYTCRNTDGKTKSFNIHVQAEGFLSAQLNETKILSAEDMSSFSLQATVSYYPLLTHCFWEAPNKTVTKCTRDTWVTKHRNVMLHQPLETGEYKLHLEAGGHKETKTISVCVVDTPKFTFTEDDDEVMVHTSSLVPANYSWLSCSSMNDSCEIIHNETDSDVLCDKMIKRNMSKYWEGSTVYLKFCLTNSINSWCDKYHLIWPKTSKVLQPKDHPQDDGTLLVLKVGSLSLLLALVVVSVVLVFVIKKKKPQYQPQLQMIQMVGPNDNDYIYINFKDFLYDQKWEFPRENLELGKELGSGAFGMVVQATAYGINKPGVSQQVAVKMLKEKHHSVEKEALMSELKMLTHIGHHDNIVNLLGACTDSGPIYLIFQYCCYGDLLNYLKINSDRYHKSVTDAFNKDRFTSLYHNLRLGKNQSELEPRMETYVPMFSSTSRGQEDIALLTFNSNDMDSFEDPVMFENPDDDRDDLEALTFEDLLSFAFQVAKGMEFLSSKHCIHRDLAARNVLVTKGRLVKIGDFGLARDIDNDSNYVVRGNVRLPVKWMAPESIFQGLYTMKSDVWAYGILLWEIFSLGVTPYPGMKVDHKFYSMIERGFMMDCPYYADKLVYEMMCKCWALEPSNRPSFSKLVSFMYDLLTDREDMLYYNMLNQDSSEYQNASAILDISSLTKHDDDDKTQAGNDYCKTNATEDSKAEVCDSVVVAAEEKEEKEEKEEEEEEEEKIEDEEKKPFDME